LSLNTDGPGGGVTVGVGVTVAVPVAVGVAVGVAVTVGVAVGVAVTVGVAVGVVEASVVDSTLKSSNFAVPGAFMGSVVPAINSILTADRTI
jgi:hypothetical protein